MSQRVTILGSTGSIGRQSLEVIAACGMEAAALAANSSVKLMEEQARRFKPAIAALADEKAAADLRVRLADTNVQVLSGLEGKAMLVVKCVGMGAAAAVVYVLLMLLVRQEDFRDLDQLLGRINGNINRMNGNINRMNQEAGDISDVPIEGREELHETV